MPSPIGGSWRWPSSPRQQQQRSKSKPKEIASINFDKLFEDERLRRRAKSCSRSDRVFDIPTQMCRNIDLGRRNELTKQIPQVGSYNTSDKTTSARLSNQSFLQRLTRRQSKSVREEAEETRSKILETLCPPSRSIPGRSVELSMIERIEYGLDCDEVLPGVILASGKTVKNVAYMRELRVTHIINTASRDVWLPVEKLSNLGVKMFQFHVDDVPTANITPYFSTVAEFVAEARKGGGLIVINCLVGLSRSATVLAASLMINNRWTVQKALKKLRKGRPVKPNIGFMVQLLNLEQKLLDQGERLI